jgi:hypothetical protein
MAQGRPPKDSEPWFERVAARMVRENESLRVAALAEGLDLTPEEAVAAAKRRAFQKVLWQARLAYYNEVGSDPGRTKQTVLGQMILAAQKLMEADEWEKAALVNEKIARVAGWMGAEAEQNVFVGLSQKDIDEVKKQMGAPEDVQRTFKN